MDFAERMRKNERISTNNSVLPPFPGMFLAFNASEGKFSIMEPGADFSEANDIKSITILPHFMMNRVKWTRGTDEKALSNYVVTDTEERQPYVITIDGETYTAETMMELKQQIVLGQNEQLKQEEIYVGYATALDDVPQKKPLVVWYVSRGVNAYVLNDAIDGDLTGRSIIKLENKGTTRKNNSGSINKVLDFKVDEIAEDKVEGMLKWVSQDSSDKIVEAYRDDMINAAMTTANPAPTVLGTQQNSEDDVPDVPPFNGTPALDPFGQPINEVGISDDELPF